MKTKMYIFANLSCPNCAAKLEKAASQLPGVHEARVSYAAGALNLRYDEAVLDEEKLRNLFHQFSLELTSVLPAKV
ncbi:MAG TPA: cation transporter [Firmicutes bacterium]|nr:cation transporter [Candidatus Fermentithermobacillaceae bacterium]